MSRDVLKKTENDSNCFVHHRGRCLVRIDKWPDLSRRVRNSGGSFGDHPLHGDLLVPPGQSEQEQGTDVSRTHWFEDMCTSNMRHTS